MVLFSGYYYKDLNNGLNRIHPWPYQSKFKAHKQKITNLIYIAALPANVNALFLYINARKEAVRAQEYATVSVKMVLLPT